MKEILSSAEETIKAVKESSTNILSFVNISMVILVAAIVGVAGWSKMPEWLNITLIAIFTLLFCLILLLSFFKALKKPQTFIFNSNAFIIAMREKLMDSDHQTPYFSDQTIDLKTEAPMELSEGDPAKKSK